MATSCLRVTHPKPSTLSALSLAYESAKLKHLDLQLLRKRRDGLP